MDEREMFDAWLKSHDGGASAFECWIAGRRTTPDRESIIEECAKVCDEYSADRWNLFKGRKPYEGTESGRADPYTYGASDGADQCSERIRALKTAPISDKGDASSQPFSLTEDDPQEGVAFQYANELVAKRLRGDKGGA